MVKYDTKKLCSRLFAIILLSVIAVSFLSSCDGKTPSLPDFGDIFGGEELPEYKSEYFLSEGVYNGSLFEVKLTDAGKKVFGSDFEFKAEVYAYIPFDDPEYKNPAAEGKSDNLSTFGGVCAGKHFYRITEVNSGTVISDKHVVTILKKQVERPSAIGENSFVFDGKTHSLKVGAVDEAVKISGDVSAVDVGEYSVLISLKDEKNYEWTDGGVSSFSKEWSIKKASAVITLDTTPIVKKYGEKFTLPKATSNFGEVHIDKSVEDMLDVGSYIVTYRVDETSNYYGAVATVSVTINATVETMLLDKPFVLSSVSFVYNGEAKKLAFSGLYDSAMTLSGNIATDAGTYTATISLKDKTKYKWSDGTTHDLNFTWTIEKASVIITVDKTPIVKNYGEEIILPEASSNFGVVKVDKTAEDLKDAGVYTVTYFVEESDNYYSKEEVISVTINKISLRVPEIIGKYVYNRTLLAPKFTEYDEKLIEIEYEQQTNAGTYDVTLRLLDSQNYSWEDESFGEKVIKWTIEKASATITLDTTPIVKHYGEEFTLPEAASDFGTVIVDKTIDEVKEVGSYTITYYVEETDNYYGDIKTLSVTINGASMQFIKPALISPVTFVYDSSEKKLIFSGVDERYMTISGNTATDADTYTAVISLIDRTECAWSDGTNDDIIIDWTITKATPAITLDTTPIVKNYGEQIILPEAASDFGTVLTDKTAKEIEEIGTYTVTYYVEESENYYGASKTIEVTVKNIVVKAPTVTLIHTYTGYAIKPNVVGFDEKYMSLSGDAEGLGASDYYMTFSLKDKSHCIWEDGTNDDVIIKWSIEKATAVINLDTTPIVKNYGEELVLPSATSSFGKVLVDKTLEDLKSVGSYTVTYYVEETDNYYGASAAVSVTINTLRLIKPTLTTTTAKSYDKTVKEITFDDIDTAYMTISGNSATNAGSYTVRIALKDKNNCAWQDGSCADIVVNWLIAKAVLNNPTLNSSSELTYNGSEQGISFSGLDSEFMNASSDKATAVGKYTAVITLKDADNYEWAGSLGGSGALSFEWSIKKRAYKAEIVSSAVQFSGNDAEVTIVLKSDGVSDISYTIKIPASVINGYYTAGDKIDVSRKHTIDLSSINIDLNNCYVDNNLDGIHDTSVTLQLTILGTVSVTNSSKVSYYADLASALALTSGTVNAVQSITYNGVTYTVNKDYYHIISSNVTVNEKVTLNIPYDNLGSILNKNGGDTDGKYGSDGENGSDIDGKYHPTLKNRVVIKSGKTLTIRGTVNVGGVLGVSSSGLQGPAGSTSGDFSIIELESGSSIISYSTLNVYGFIIESENNTANVKVESGKITMPFAVHDYNGGSHTVGAYEPGGESPFNIFDMPNVQAKLACKSGSEMYALASLFTSEKNFDFGIIDYETPAAYNHTEIKMFGTSGAVFNMTSGYAYFDYDPEGITQYHFENGKYSYRRSYLADTREARTHITLAGNTTSGALKMHVVIIRTLVERDIDLATVLFPVSYKMVISLTGNYNYTFTNDFKFLPGSELIIGQGANVMVNSDSSLIFYDDFKDENGKDYSSEINLISTNTTISNSLKIPFYPTKYQNTAAVCKVSGTLRVEGEIAGRIIPESDSARLDLSNAKNLTITAKEVNGGFKETSGTSETVYYEVQKANGLAYSSEGSEIRLLENKVYGAFSTETGYAFRERKDSIVLSYNSGGGSSVSDAVYNNVWLDVGVTLSGSNLPSITKKYYTFEGWYLDSGFETSANGHTVYENTQIYAKWSADTYYTEYLFVFEGFTPEVIPTLPENIAFTADTAAIMMPAVPESGYIFNGWYKDADCNHRILTSISGKELLDSGGKIYGQWVALQYTVTYADDKYGDVPYSGGVGNFTPTQLIDQRLPEVKSYERDATKEYYFIGWEYNGVLYENYSFIDLSDTEKLDYTITAKWAKKYALSVEGSSGGNTAVSFTESTVFLYDNKQIAEYFDSYTKKAKQYDDDITVNKYFSGWNNSYTSLTTDSFGESKALTLKANWANKKSHTITVTVTSSKLSSASWSVTALTQNGETYTKDIASDSGTATKTTSVTLYFVTSLEVSITAAGQGKANGWTGYYKAKVTVGKNTTTETAILSGSLGPATRTDKITLADGGTTSVKITT